MDTIRNLGDLAAASGKNVMQAIEAYSNMITGRTGIAVKQFRALLISTDDWTREIGKSVLQNTGDVTASVEEMINALPRIIARKNFIGLMDKQSQTLLGRVSNLEDAWQQLMATIGDEFMASAKNAVQWLIETFETLKVEVPRLIGMLKDLGSILYHIGGAWAVWKIGVKTMTLFNTAVILMRMPLAGLVSMVTKTKVALTGLTAAQYSAGLAAVDLHKNATGLQKRLFSLFAMIRSHPIFSWIVALSAVATAIYFVVKATEENLAVQAKAAEQAVKNTKAQKDEAKILLEGKKLRNDLLDSYVELADKTNRTAEENEEYEKTIIGLRQEFPHLIKQIEDGTFTTEEAQKMAGQYRREINYLQKEIRGFDTKMFQEQIKAMKLNFSVAIKKMREDADDLVGIWDRVIFAMAKGGSGFERSGPDPITDEMRKALEKSTFGFRDAVNDYADEMERLSESGDVPKIRKKMQEMLNKLSDPEFGEIDTDKWRKTIKDMAKQRIDVINKELSGVYESELLTMDRILTEKLRNVKKPDITWYQKYLKDIRAKLAKVNAREDFEQEGVGTIKIAVEGIDKDDTFRLTEQKAQAVTTLLQNIESNLSRGLEGLEKEAEEKSTKAGKERLARLKAFEEEYKK
jgi:hypothetical protein